MLASHTRALPPQLPGRAGLTQIYQAFCDRMSALREAGLTVPQAEAGQHRFLQEVENQAFYAMDKAMRPRNSSERAMLSVTIPDLVLARVDHIASEDLLEHLTPIVLTAWDELSYRLGKRSAQYFVLTLPTALEIVEMRMQTEASHHRPVSQFFTGAAYAH